MKTLTKPQYLALSKWADGKVHNEVALRVRSDMHYRLRVFKHLQFGGWLQSVITPEGVAALAAYDAKHGVLAADE
jgi:hypothetical protein